MVAPIFLYRAEVHGYKKSDIIETLFLQVYKIILSFKKSTPNVILYGELGRYPAEVLIKPRVIGFWKRLVCGKQDKIPSVLYNLVFKMHSRNIYFSKWIDCVERTLNNCGYSEYWLNHHVPENCGLSRKVKLRLINQYKQNWYSSMFESQI